MPQHSSQSRLLPRCLASAFCSLLLALPLVAQHSAPPLVLSGAGGIALGIGSAELFDSYRQATGLRANEFSVPLVASAGVAVALGSVRVGAECSYFRAESRERGSPTGATATQLDERLQLQLVPVVLALEWEPWHQQFRTYLSAGVGATFARFQWNERVWSSGTLVRDGSNADETVTVPALRLGAGTYLFFDEESRSAVRGGLVIAVQYQFSPVRVAALRYYATLYDRQQWNGPINVGGSGLLLTLGVRFWLGRP
ncbi:MAG: hypothetical protein KatS3mg040_0172 [Candidatus Kapaibacterium sp.]|nr:MAG: hypothetical protein KatS3mg040_0172 [Candidatus Kapabacteria bacterium]